MAGALSSTTLWANESHPIASIDDRGTLALRGATGGRSFPAQSVFSLQSNRQQRSQPSSPRERTLKLCVSPLFGALASTARTRLI